ncbi:MAG: hypothetical protein PHR66_12565 [Desulfuromonadaceae bacterium]|nr:hypothetical protein [Desulfuromonadaceae bacterium]
MSSLLLGSYRLPRLSRLVELSTIERRTSDERRVGAPLRPLLDVVAYTERESLDLVAIRYGGCQVPRIRLVVVVEGVPLS